jgi:hypothetical protein
MKEKSAFVTFLPFRYHFIMYKTHFYLERPHKQRFCFRFRDLMLNLRQTEPGFLSLKNKHITFSSFQLLNIITMQFFKQQHFFQEPTNSL